MFKSKIVIAAIALSLSGTAPALAHNMNLTDWVSMMQRLRRQQSNPLETPWVSARVVKVNGTAQTITVSHGAIKDIGMPPMTMTFGIADATRLSQLKKGDRVDIQVEYVWGEAKIVNFRSR